MPKEETPFALCPNCRAPLISTLDFPGAEFYCLECGHKCGFMSPVAGAPTPELNARYIKLKREWDEHAANKLLFHSGWLSNCEKCEPHQEPHRDHATPDDWAAHQDAWEWLKARAAA